MRSTVVVTVTVTLVFVVLSGCAQTRGLGPTPNPVTQSLLFDAHPGWPTASEMACRSTWPATLAWQGGGEEVWYRERLIDVQTGGQGRGRPYDYVYRRFDTYRVGRAAR